MLRSKGTRKTATVPLAVELVMMVVAGGEGAWGRG